jgi:hypothetical protein
MNSPRVNRNFAALLLGLLPHCAILVLQLGRLNLMRGRRFFQPALQTLNILLAQTPLRFEKLHIPFSRRA